MALKALTAEERQALAKLRAIAGGMRPEERTRHQAFLARRKAIREFLANGAATVPSIADAVKLRADEVLWHLTGMRKYGQVVEAGEDGDYLLYALAAQETATAAGHR
jgi:predicted transcriptional regulator